jgi:hypothetical protein
MILLQNPPPSPHYVIEAVSTKPSPDTYPYPMTDEIAEFFKAQQDLRNYLSGCWKAGEVEEKTIRIAFQIWLKVAQRLRVPVPDASTGPRRQVMLTWDNGRDHLEIEVFPDGVVEYFYYDRENKKTWEAEEPISMVDIEGESSDLARPTTSPCVPEELFTYLRRFV